METFEHGLCNVVWKEGIFVRSFKIRLSSFLFSSAGFPVSLSLKLRLSRFPTEYLRTGETGTAEGEGLVGL